MRKLGEDISELLDFIPGYFKVIQHGATVEELLRASDAAMYRAKRRGGAAFEFFSPELTNQAMEKLQLQNSLRHPDLLSQLVVHYQPQLDLRSDAIVSVEALVRWNSGGLLLPGRFIKAAEEAGLITAIGDWVLRTACKDAVAWQSSSQGLSLRVAVNVSAHQIQDERIVAAVRLALGETGLHPALLELEVTEDALQIGDAAKRVLQQLAQAARHSTRPRRFRFWLLVAGLPEGPAVRSSKD